MIVAIPVTPSDLYQVPFFINALNRAGQAGLGNHEAIVFSGPECASYAALIVKALQGKFFRVSKVEWDADTMTHWPNGANECFQRVAHHIAKLDTDEPFLFCELDMIPIKSGWADALQLAYRQAAQPCLGVVAPTFKAYRNDAKTLEGDPLPPRIVKEDKHMVGAGVYPAKFALQSTLLRFLDSLNPFDIQLQYEIFAMGVAHTDLISHHFNTVNYRREGDKVVCDDKEPEKLFDAITYSGEVNMDAVLVHGCKDGSLSELLAGSPAPHGSNGRGGALESVTPLTAKQELEVEEKDEEDTPEEDDTSSRENLDPEEKSEEVFDGRITTTELVKKARSLGIKVPIGTPRAEIMNMIEEVDQPA